MKPKNIPGVPKHYKGSYHDTESIKNIEKHEDIDFQFNILKQRFFAINNWRKYCPESTTDFKLFDSAGIITERIPEIGDYIRIDIPGPGGSEGRSFDWVQIVMLDKESEDLVLMQCRPCHDPSKSGSRKVAHFYSNAATSTFIVSKHTDFIKAGIYGRNESPNFNSGFFNSLRNLMVAVGGMLGFSKVQWKCLSNGLVNF
ncbi:MULTISPECIES: hypothetical protein [Chryseobacterium]|uniref:Uncharacterized protein n=1 Tax=Chryseobacterium taihuense TaxID=1141221 RepID=A0A4V6ID76_9FLAO|nr:MULTISPECIES: hypothetical protein [Chryseobacterium]QQV04307.1 hypothetical protein I6I61_08215 [Chryseobacterium sp. FDAARGOS 1104]VFB02324.1 Uncharacterised protein [Chryseobacterium taihuense]